jgi:hypothetical protein
MHACLGRLHGIALVVDRRCWTGEIVDLVYFDVERKRNVVPDKLEILVVEKMFDVAPRLGKKNINADDFATFGNQPIAKLRSDRSSSARDQDALADESGGCSWHSFHSLQAGGIPGCKQLCLGF